MYFQAADIARHESRLCLFMMMFLGVKHLSGPHDILDKLNVRDSVSDWITLKLILETVCSPAERLLIVRHLELKLLSGLHLQKVFKSGTKATVRTAKSRQTIMRAERTQSRCVMRGQRRLGLQVHTVLQVGLLARR